MRVAVDAMGGDHAPRVVVEGAEAAVRESGVPVMLVGPSDRLRAALSPYPDAARLDLRFVDADEVVETEESPAQALRRKSRASIIVAAGLVARGEAAALQGRRS
jgi:glycerol-3-phosphate acyltransferase PlsX